MFNIYPKISVCLITYNQGRYISDAILGGLMQQYPGDIEIIVADDHSDDNTEQLVKEIIATHPNGSWIHYTKHAKNKGMMLNLIWTLSQCTGKYVATCEGDDYWTDPSKLLKQVECLEMNGDCVMCFHKVAILQTSGEVVNDFITHVPVNYETIQALAASGNYIHTPTVMFRNLWHEFPDEFYVSPLGDYFHYMLLAERGIIKMLPECMAVYRNGVGVWSSQAESCRLVNRGIALSLMYKYFHKKGSNVVADILFRRIYSILRNNELTENDINRIINMSNLQDRVTNELLLENRSLSMRDVQKMSAQCLINAVLNRLARKVRCMMGAK